MGITLEGQRVLRIKCKIWEVGDGLARKNYGVQIWEGNCALQNTESNLR